MNEEDTTMRSDLIIGIAGSGAMGTGIAQVAATAGHRTVLYDNDPQALKKAQESLGNVLSRLTGKGKMTKAEADTVAGRIVYAGDIALLKNCDLIIEAVVENPEVKRALFAGLEKLAGKDALLATNTSSLSVTSIASACSAPERVIGMHFFNPAPLMPLVEIVPAVQTSAGATEAAKELVQSWGKTAVLAKDTPGFIVNRLARPFYGEAIRIFEEGFADIATIDRAMKEKGGFRMGPFELMDFIGNDVNYTVTETVFREFFCDPRYKPSFTQKRMVESGRLGRKTGIGYYDYRKGAKNPEPKKNDDVAHDIFIRILVMLINEAADALFLGIATRDDLDLAMTKGVNYPKGLLAWADGIGIKNVLETLEFLQREYGEDRYRPSPLLRQMVRKGDGFYGRQPEQQHSHEH